MTNPQVVWTNIHIIVYFCQKINLTLFRTLLFISQSSVCRRLISIRDLLDLLTIDGIMLLSIKASQFLKTAIAFILMSEQYLFSYIVFVIKTMYLKILLKWINNFVCGEKKQCKKVNKNYCHILDSVMQVVKGKAIIFISIISIQFTV